MGIFRVSGAHRQKFEKHIFNIEVIAYIDEGVYYMVSPALDITGAGETEGQAKESFEVMMDEFTKYTSHKNTIQGELKRLGWTVTGNPKKASSYRFPVLQSFANNPAYAGILAKKPTVQIHKIELPL